jgi:hypothetical protein
MNEVGNTKDYGQIYLSNLPFPVSAPVQAETADETHAL